MKALQAWFQSLAPRDQRMLLLGAAAGALIVVLGVWLPLERHVVRLEEQVRTRQADLAWLQTVAPQLGAMRSAPRGSGSESVIALADRVAHETGIARALNTQAAGDGSYSVHFEQVAFDSLLNWAAELVLQHGVRIVSASIDGGPNAGVVSATIVLRAS
ncbi:MAG: type II secretion system protein M [Gammaproteobacteria bacterium]|nr:type II secretion system protein M [Gammaproteobacteria bacterium]